MQPIPLEVRNVPLPVASAIMREAAAWLIARGEPLWPLENLTDEKLAARCAPHEVFVGYRANAPLVAAIVQDRDDYIWPGIADSIFVHKLSLRRAAAGQGVAAQMLDWVCRVGRERRKNYVRLDCAGDRPKLCAFYESCGFRHVNREVIDGFDYARYEFAL